MEMTIEGLLPSVRAASRLVAAAVALALALGRRREDAEMTHLGLSSPAASPNRSTAEAPFRTG